MTAKPASGANSSFLEILRDRELDLSRRQVSTLQINLGKLCNQACLHCHVDAGPKRSEIMQAKTADRIIQLLRASSSIEVVDITGGAPELCPEFKRLVIESRQLGHRVIDRCNLTIFFEEGYGWVPGFLAEQAVSVVASLPCYTLENVERQRGRGSFQKSIDALRWLNELGYGKDDSTLQLDLVYNPLGPFLPGSQKKLESDYKIRLSEDFGISFNRLFTITNMPISRFLHDLERQGRFEEYMQLLRQNFNPEAASNVMCRDLVSVGWQGELYDCDFNQMLEMPLEGSNKNIWQLSSFDELQNQGILFAEHCFGCTAGAGSSCSGATV